MYMGDSIQPQVALRLSFSINLKASRCFTGSLPSHILNPRRTGGLASRGRPLLCCSTIHWNYSPPAAHQWMGDLRMGSLPWQRIKTVKGRAKSCFSFNLFILVPIYLSSTEIYEGYFYLSLSSLSEGYMVSIHRANPTLPNSLGASPHLLFQMGIGNQSSWEPQLLILGLSLYTLFLDTTFFLRNTLSDHFQWKGHMPAESAFCKRILRTRIPFQ